MPEWMHKTQMYAHTAANGGRPISRVLVLAANAEGATLEDVVNRYLPAGGGLVGCVMSKIDEAPTLAAPSTPSSVTVCHCCM